MCDCFDTVGTLLGTAGSAGMLDENGNLPGGDRALIADAVPPPASARCMGTSTVTTFVESSTGISEGAPHRPDLRGRRHPVPAGLRAGAHRGHHPQRCHRPRADHRRHVHDRQRGQDRLEAISRWRCPAS